VDAEREKLVHNERTKLTAGWFNTLSGGLMAVGVFGPLATFLLGTLPPGVSGWLLGALSLACVALGTGLHVYARWTLERLR
jgi:hypothetical protein